MKQETLEEMEFCHYSGLPSLTAYEEYKQETLIINDNDNDKNKNEYVGKIDNVYSSK